MGINKTYRLKSKKRIEELFMKGNRQFHYPIQLIHLPSPRSHHRLAFIVGKKNIRDASRRNTIKRRMREQSRLLMPDFYSKNPQDILILYQGKNVVDSTRIRKALTRHLTEVGILSSV